MFYVPGVLKSVDGYWLQRSVRGLLADRKRAAAVDLVDTHFGYPEGVGALAAARACGIPCIVTLRGFETEYLDKPLIGRQIRAMLRTVDGCICVSHFLKDVAVAAGANDADIAVVHNAIDRAVFRPGDRQTARRKLGIEPDTRLILSVGHVIPRKRHHVLLAAFAQVMASVPGAQLVVIGNDGVDPIYARRIRRDMSALGVGDAVRFAGNMPPAGVADWLQAADLFALATQREGCCNAILEALASGLPVVTTPVGDNAYFVEDGHNGRIVPVDDVAATAQGIVDVLTHGSYDPQSISASLPVAGWDTTASAVLDFFRARLDR